MADKKVRCDAHLHMCIARTKNGEPARKCGHMMVSGGYDYCRDCAEKLGVCMLCSESVAEP
jgi:hypothetical protein